MGGHPLFKSNLAERTQLSMGMVAGKGLKDESRHILKEESRQILKDETEQVHSGCPCPVKMWTTQIIVPVKVHLECK